MTKEQIGSVLADAGCTQADGGWVLPDDKTLGIHTAVNGVGLSVGRVVSVRLSQELLCATKKSGEQQWLLLSGVIGLSTDGGGKAGRKAGFR